MSKQKNVKAIQDIVIILLFSPDLMSVCTHDYLRSTTSSACKASLLGDSGELRFLLNQPVKGFFGDVYAREKNEERLLRFT